MNLLHNAFLNKLFSSSVFDKPLSFNYILELLKNRTIRLQIEDDFMSELSEENINLILETMPSLLKIANRPKSFIINKEETVPVELAKRINHRSIMKLTRNSNDWHERTLLRIKPKNISAVTSEETFNIYENRFFVTLIDKVSNVLVSSKNRINGKLEKLARTDCREAMDAFYSHDNKTFFYKLLNGDDSGKRYVDVKSMYQNKLEDIEQLLKKITVIKNSRLYASLRKCKRVSNPIIPTNILLFSKDYKKAFYLWNNLVGLMPELSLIQDTFDTEDNLYLKYNTMCLIASLGLLGFKDVSDTEVLIDFRDSNFKIDKLKLISKQDRIFFSLKDKEIELFFNKNEDCKSVKNKNKNKENNTKLCEHGVSIVSNHEDYTEASSIKIDSMSEKLLYEFNSKVSNDKKIAERKSFEIVKSRFAFINIDPSKRANLDEYKNDLLNKKVCRRLFSLGDYYVPEDITKYPHINNYQVGFISSDIEDLANVLVKIERFLQIHIVQTKFPILDKPNTYKSFYECPVCGSEKFREIREGLFGCQNINCSKMFATAICSHCGNYLNWIKYKDDKSLDYGLDATQSFFDLPFESQCSRLEHTMGTTAITSFVVENENGKRTLKTICPHCGCVLGNDF